MPSIGAASRALKTASRLIGFAPWGDAFVNFAAYGSRSNAVKKTCNRSLVSISSHSSKENRDFWRRYKKFRK